jgi:hypothetical protein
MGSPDTHSERPREQAEPPTPTPREPDRGIIGRWRQRRVELELARLLRPRHRRALADRLRRAARDANGKRGGLDVLLHYRAAAVRTELLEIAALLEQATDPDPTCVKEIHELLANGDSPLYHPGAHVSELYATLYYVRAGLVRDHAPRLAPRPQITNDRGIGPGCTDAIPRERRMQ